MMKYILKKGVEYYTGGGFWSRFDFRATLYDSAKEAEKVKEQLHEPEITIEGKGVSWDSGKD